MSEENTRSTLKLCWEIEKLPASKQQTKVSEVASEIDNHYQSIKTGVRQVAGEWSAFFSIGNQTFTLRGMETKEDAEWQKEMLDKALYKL